VDNHLLYTAIGIFLGSFGITYYLMPKIIIISNFQRIHATPNERSSHSSAVPNIGGSAFFICLMLGLYFIYPYDKFGNLIAFIPGLTILFIVGLKDDLVVLAPLTKLAAQIASAIFFVFQYKWNIESLHGFMGIDNMPPILAAFLAVVIIVSCINAINLIDGIDGLAATIAIIMFSVFASLFFVTERYFLFLLAILMIGSLIAFLRFNLSKDKKIFMGDTGSMILGFLIGAMTIRFLSLDDLAISKLPFQYANIPFVVGAILIVPFFDTARVFTLRILQKRSPFSADRSHIHHIIVDKYQISHRRASFFIGVAHFLFIVLFSILAMYTSHWQLLVFFALAILAAVIFFFVINKPRRKFDLKS
jgi:UDP-GlcNAc:undecaprenyl-phosphate/decaprenyl-phosphate GlcNAc-1-phosphate transferase